MFNDNVYNYGEIINIAILVQSLKVVVLAVSLGGVESLVCHPASMTHCDHYVSPEAKEASGITDALIRLRFAEPCHPVSCSSGVLLTVLASKTSRISLQTFHKRWKRSSNRIYRSSVGL